MGRGGKSSDYTGRRRDGEGVAGSVGANGLLDPGGVSADLRVDGGVLNRAAGVNTPGQDALQGLVADQGATGVTLWGGGRSGRIGTPV